MIEFRPVGGDRARECLAPLTGSPKVDTTEGLHSLSEIIGAGRAFEAWRDGVPLMLVVLLKQDRAHGKELEIRAAVALTAGVNATDEVLAAVEAGFAWDCDVMTVYTRRAGLVRKLERAGFCEAAKIMRKKIKCTA